MHVLLFQYTEFLLHTNTFRFMFRTAAFHETQLSYWCEALVQDTLLEPKQRQNFINKHVTKLYQKCLLITVKFELWLLLLLCVSV